MPTREDVLRFADLTEGTGPENRQIELAESLLASSAAVGDADLVVRAHMILTDAYRKGGDEWSAIEPFVWTVARATERPDLFSRDDLQVLSLVYSHVIAIAASNPAASTHQVACLLAAFDRYTERLGLPRRPLHEASYTASVLLGRQDATDDDLTALELDDGLTPRGESARVTRLVDDRLRHGDTDGALRVARGVLDGTLRSATQPRDTLAQLLLPLVESGRPERAWDAHLRSYALHRRRPSTAAWLKEHLSYLALTGQLERGMRLLRRHGRWTASTDAASDLLDMLQGAYLVLREVERAARGLPEGELWMPTRLEMPPSERWRPSAHVTRSMDLPTALAATRQWVSMLAGAFDERNGNDVISTEVGEWLERPRLLEGPGTEHVVRLVRAPEPLPGDRPSESATPSDEALSRTVAAANEALSSHRPSLAITPMVALARVLEDRGRDLEASDALEVAHEIAAASGSRRAPALARGVRRTLGTAVEALEGPGRAVTSA